jgi:nucleotide-binding universal stress UspA family protein
MIRIQKILYATDFSSYSNQAYFHAVALAENHGASLTVLFVFPTVLGADWAPDEGEDREYWRHQLEQIRPIDPTIRVNHVMLEGDPASEIVRYAQEAGMDLIVMGTHGRTGLERLLMGSVAEKVMRLATCSVLVVKLPRGIPVAEQATVAVAGSPA